MHALVVTVFRISFRHNLIISGVQFKPEEMLDRLAGSTNEDENQAESRDLWRMFECHAQILSGHEERLENNITKIEIIREMLEEKKGTSLEVRRFSGDN